MEKEILVLIKLSNKEMLITAIEKFNDSNIKIFSDSTNPIDNILTIKFIKDSIFKIEELILAKITSVSIIFDATHGAKIKQKLISEKISNLNKREITESDYFDALTNMKKFYSSDNSKDYVSILFQPFQFKLIDNSDNSSKKYHELPIGKKADKLEILFSMTTLSTSYYNSIVDICSKADLNIAQIYSSSNANPYILENNKRGNTLVTLEVEKNYSNLIITKNGVTIVTKNLSYDYDNLVDKMAAEFKVSKKIVDDLIITEGIITKDKELLNKVIFHKKNIIIKAFQLTSILKSFIKTLIIEIDTFIKMNHELLKNYTLNIIGRIEKIVEIEEYCQSVLSNKKIFINKRPINYLLLEYTNRSIFGLLKMIDNIKKITNVNALITDVKSETVPQKGWLKSMNKKNNMLLLSK